MDRETQITKIKRKLRKNGRISLDYAVYHLHCLRLAARISEINAEFARTGEGVVKNIQPKGKRAVYKLIKSENDVLIGEEAGVYLFDKTYREEIK